MSDSGIRSFPNSPFNIRLFSIYLAFALIIPAVTILIEALIALDPTFRSNLQVDLQNFHVYQLFTSSFVHLDFNHFIGNVTAYLLIIIYGLVLATMLNRKRLYLALTKMIVLVFVVFGAAFALFNITATYYAGLSGIDAALAGLLLLFWLMYLEQKTRKPLGNYLGVFIAGILVLILGIILRYMQLYRNTHGSTVVPILAEITFLLLISTLIIFRRQVMDAGHDISGFSWPSKVLTVGIIAVMAYFIWNIFPEPLGHSTRIASLSLHLGGVILGILAGYIFMIYLIRVAYFHGEPEVVAGQQENGHNSSIWAGNKTE